MFQGEAFDLGPEEFTACGRSNGVINPWASAVAGGLGRYRRQHQGLVHEVMEAEPDVQSG